MQNPGCESFSHGYTSVDQLLEDLRILGMSVLGSRVHQDSDLHSSIFRGNQGVSKRWIVREPESGIDCHRLVVYEREERRTAIFKRRVT